MKYPNHPVSTWKLIGDSFRYYALTLKSTFFLVLLAALVQQVPVGFDLLVRAPALQMVCEVGVTLVALFFWSSAIVRADSFFVGRCYSMRATLSLTLRRIVYVMTIVGAYVLLFILFALWLRVLTHLGVLLNHSPALQAFINLVVAGLPLLIIFLGLIFSLALVLTKSARLWAAVKQSFALAWQTRFKSPLTLYLAIMILVYLVLPFSRHGQWLIAHQIKVPADLVVLVLLAPLVINFMLLALNNPGEK